MSKALRSSALRVVVLKWDRLYGDMICRHILEVWPDASVSVFQKGLDALDSIQASVPDLFITGAKIDDMDGLEHLEPFIDTSLPILVVMSRPDTRTFSMLREVRYDGIYDGVVEGLDKLPSVLRQVLEHRLYVSPSIQPHMKQPKNLTLDALTLKEQVVLSVIGDGSDDFEAGDRLGVSAKTINCHRTAIMRKLKFHHKGQLMRYALQEGFVRVTSNGIYYPGYQRRIERKIRGRYVRSAMLTGGAK